MATRVILHLLGYNCNLYAGIGDKLKQKYEMVEYLHRQLKAALMSHDAHEHWVDNLPIVLLGIRSSLKPDVNACAADLICYSRNCHETDNPQWQTCSFSRSLCFLSSFLSAQPSTFFLRRFLRLRI